MADVLLNGRPAVDFELAAVERARQCELARDTELLAGVLTVRGETLPERPDRDGDEVTVIGGAL